ncbi:TPA: hypothetical protein ACH3X2_002640 [Trebouxia sp. C0005]
MMPPTVLSPKKDTVTIPSAPTTAHAPEFAAASSSEHPMLTEVKSHTDMQQDMPAEPPRRLQQPDIIEGDFIVVKIYKTVRKDGDRKGKSVSKAEGPYLVKGFTDATKQIAIFADANDIT